MQRVTVWISTDDIDRLRKRFPGMRGGIDWAAIVAQASGSANEPSALSDNGQEQVRKPAKALRQEPIPYWKPNPLGPREKRCQGSNRDGSRCKRRGEFNVMATGAEGRVGEFVTCKPHRDEFRPHRSVVEGFGR